jgi:hypothetical protein
MALGGAWTPQQRQRVRQFDVGTWPSGRTRRHPGWPDNSPVHPAIEIAVYPDVIRLATHTLRTPDTGHRAGP